MPDHPDLLKKCHQVFNLADQKLRHLLSNHPDFFPMYTDQGKWLHSKAAWTNWCEGFLGGQLWLLYRYTDDPFWRERAEHYSRLVEHRKSDRNVHDLGFLFLSTYKRWYDLTGDQTLNQVLIEAGQTLALRFNEKGKFLRSFLAADSLFIDIMMNVPIIFYAAQQTNDADLLRIATQHSLTTRKYLVRGDGSVSHEGIFDLSSGEFLKQTTQQGWRNDSSWARGLAWSLYGFGTVYAYTQDPRFLQVAEANAAFYIERTPSHGIPPNDWDDPAPLHPYESSAAAIAASGLIQLSQLVGDPGKGQYYYDTALRILDTLTSPEFLGMEENWEGILKHGTYHYNHRLGVDESVAWGDHFFLEAVSKVVEHER
jgi:unsaturated chondroitin disaccharide hydrolase